MSKLRVIVSGLMFGQTVQNVLHLRNDDDANNTPQVVAAYVKTNWVDKVAFMQNNNLNYRLITVHKMEEGGPAPFSLTIDVKGNQLQDHRQLCTSTYVVRLQTARAGRHGRGRWLLSGVVGDHILDGFVTASALDQWATNTLGPITAAFVENPSTSLVVCVRAKNNDYTPVTNISLRGRIGSLYSRTIGVGI